MSSKLAYDFRLWIRRKATLFLLDREERRFRQLALDLDDIYGDYDDRRLPAIQALESLGERRALELLKARINSEGLNPTDVARAIAAFGSPEAIDFLLVLLQHDDKAIRAAAARQLAFVATPDSVSALRASLQRHGFEPETGIALVRLGDKQSAWMLLDHLYDPDVDWWRGLDALEDAGPDYLEEVAAHRAIQARDMQRLVELGTTAVGPLINRARAAIRDLKEESSALKRYGTEKVLSESVSALRDIGDERAVELLWEVADAGIDTGLALDALTGTDAGVDSIVRRIRSSSAANETSALFDRLAGVGSAAVFEHLVSLIGHEDEAIGAAACWELHAQNDERVPDALASAFDFPGEPTLLPEYRWGAAALALQKSGSVGRARLEQVIAEGSNPNARAFLEETRERWDRPVRTLLKYGLSLPHECTSCGNRWEAQTSDPSAAKFRDSAMGPLTELAVMQNYCSRCAHENCPRCGKRALKHSAIEDQAVNMYECGACSFTARSTTGRLRDCPACGKSSAMEVLGLDHPVATCCFCQHSMAV